MALTANIDRNKLAGETLYRADGVTDEFYAGGYAHMGGPDHGTSATIGRIAPFNDEAGSIPLGFILNRQTGSVSATPVPEVYTDIGGSVVKVAVTGLAGTKADNQTPVYATDDAEFTFTRPTVGIPIGYVKNFIDTDDAFVHFYPKVVMDAIALAGCGQESKMIAHVDCATLTTADVRTSIPLPNHGEVLSFDAYADEVITGSGGSSVALNLEVGTTNVTGGVVTLSAAAGGTKGAKMAGTSITAANAYNEGDTLSVEAVLTGAALTAGTVDLWIEYAYKLGT